MKAVFKNCVDVSMRSNTQLKDWLTIADSINPSSQPKARTTRNRTKHRSDTVISDAAKKTAVTMVMASLRPVTMFALRSDAANDGMKEMKEKE